MHMPRQTHSTSVPFHLISNPTVCRSDDNAVCEQPLITRVWIPSVLIWRTAGFPDSLCDSCGNHPCLLSNSSPCPLTLRSMVGRTKPIVHFCPNPERILELILAQVGLLPQKWMSCHGSTAAGVAVRQYSRWSLAISLAPCPVPCALAATKFK